MSYRYLADRQLLGTRVLVSRISETGETPAGRDLWPCLYLCRHSRDGFQWGYAGSGTAQLALAMLVHHLTHLPPAVDGPGQPYWRYDARTAEAMAMDLHHEFMHSVVCKLAEDGWQLTTAAIEAKLGVIREQREAAARGGVKRGQGTAAETG